jgi:hypothetical protein
MYVLPLLLLIVIGLISVAWTPIFGVIIAIPLFIGFLAYVGMSRRADEQFEPPTGTRSPSSATESDVETGLWGERRPE